MENSRWVKEIISLQKPDGSCGYFHTLSNPTKSQPVTTEQALRRDIIIIEKDAPKDEAIKKAKSSEVIKSYIEGNSIYKEIYIPQKVINFVVKQG